MRNVTSDYKNNIKRMGRQLDSLITYTIDEEETVLGKEDLNSVNPHYQSALLKSAMKQLDIDSNVEIPVGTEINYQFGVKTRSGKNLFNGWIKGKGILSTNGSLIDNENGAISDYIPVDFNANPNYYVSGLKSTISSFIGAYNSNKEFLGRTAGTQRVGTILKNNSFTASTPQGTGDIAYLIIYQYKQPSDSGTINDIDYTKTQLEVGSRATDYEDFGMYDYIDYGNYIVKEVEKQEDTRSWLIKCCDKMLYSMKPYESVGVTFPTTIREYLTALCTKIGLTFANASDEFVNYDKPIQAEPYLDSEGGSLEYTYRDVFDEMAQVTASVICINNDDEVEIRYVKYAQGKNIYDLDLHNWAWSNFNSRSKITILGNNHFEVTRLLQDSDTAWKLYSPLIDVSENTDYYLSFDVKCNFASQEQFLQLLSTGQQSPNSKWRVGLSDGDYAYTKIEPVSDFLRFNYDNDWHRVYVVYNSGNSNKCRIHIGTDSPNLGFNENEKVEIKNIMLSTSSNTNYEPYGDTIDEEYLKDVNVNFGEKYGPINSVVFTRSGGSDSIYEKDDASIEANGLCEVKIEDNQILNGNNRDEFMPQIFSKLNGLEYYINDYDSTGITYYELMDRYNVKVGDKYYSCIMFNDDVMVTQGLEESVNANKLEKSETDYTKADKTDRRIKQAYIIVDKQNQQIDSVVQTVSTLSDMVDSQGNDIDALGTRITQTIGSITANVTAIQQTLDNGVNLVKTTTVTINDEGLSVATDTSRTNTLMTADKFSINSSGKELAFFGYDEDTNSTKAQMDNLTVTNYFIAGHHRIEKFERNGEKRTGHFYIG